MRAIATEAGLSPSNAYYWFASKDQLVQEFYRRIQVAHRERSAEALAGGGTLAERLPAVEDAVLRGDGALPRLRRRPSSAPRSHPGPR